MSLYKQYKTDTSLEEDGISIEFDGFSVTIRRASSKTSMDVRKRLEAPYVKVMRGRDLPPKLAEEILIKHLAEGIIVDWEGVTDESGKTLEATTENKIKVLTDLPDFRAELIGLAIERDLFKAEQDEDSVKN